MNEQTVSLTSLANPSDWKRTVLEAASCGPTVIDADTGILHVLRYRDIERLLGESRLHGVGLSLFDAMGITDGPLREWYGSLMFTNEGRVHVRPCTFRHGSTLLPRLCTAVSVKCALT